MKLLLTLLCTLWAYILFAQDTTSVVNPSTGKIERFIRVDQMPEPTFDIPAYLHKNIQYPAALKEKITGRIAVQFIVNIDGSISNAKILTPLQPLIDAEVIRVVNAMPKWKPGIDKGKHVPVFYTIPVYID